MHAWLCVHACSGGWRAYPLPVHVTRALADRDLVVSTGDVGDKGQKGDVGDPVKVSTVKKTSSNNGVDTYKITFSDGTYTTFKVTNGQDGDSPYVGKNGN